MAQVESTVPVQALTVGGETLTGDETRVVRAPWDGAAIAVVAAITPFNFPLNLAAHKVGPAVAAGCGTVLKPAAVAPLAAIELVRVLHEAGLPPELLSVVTGPASEIGDVLVADERVRM